MNKTIEIYLPSSKSISNRVLIINSFLNNDLSISNLSDSMDTKVLYKALDNLGEENNINIGHAGTAMRFLTAFLSVQKGEFNLSGSQRMHQRPIGVLVACLKKLGANINYIENDKYPPLLIKGTKIDGGKLQIDGSISSQFISAILLIAPSFEKGIELEIVGKIASKPYILMTLDVMSFFGINYVLDKNKIFIKKQNYLLKQINIESDWSAASYWYSIATIKQSYEIKLYGLQKNSLQGDAIVAPIYNNFGIETVYEKDFILLRKNNKKIIDFFEYDLSKFPDLAQTIVVNLCILNIPFKISGLETLKIKETNRIEALINELSKFGYNIKETESGTLEWNGESFEVTQKIKVATYQDHRMAMAFAPFLLIKNNVVIENKNVVVKSYPKFWNDFKSLNIK